MSSNTSLSIVDLRNLAEMALHAINGTLSDMEDLESSRQNEELETWENVTTGLFALFTAVIAVAVWILVKRSRTRRFNVTVFIGALLVLYVTTGAYWVVTLWATMDNYTFVSSVQQNQSSLKNTVRCLESALSDHPDLDYTSLNSTCIHIPSTLVSQYHSVHDRISTQTCVGYAAAIINVTIGDAIVWWRAIVVWQRNRVVCGIGIVLVLSRFGMLTMSTCTTCSSTIDEFSAVWAFAASCVSLCTNITATLLVAYKAWAHRKFVRSYLSTGFTRQRVEKVLLLLVESGALYCGLSVVNVIYFSGVAPQVSNGLGLFMQAAFIPLVGIYPAAIIVICAFNKQLNDTQISLRVPSIGFEDPGQSPSFTSEAWQMQNIHESTPSRNPHSYAV